MKRVIQRRQIPIPPQTAALVSLAESLSPGMAQVLEKVVAGHLTGIRPRLDVNESMLLGCAAAALSVVNRTPGSAKAIGHHAALAVSRNPQSIQLLKTVPRRIA